MKQRFVDMQSLLQHFSYAPNPDMAFVFFDVPAKWFFSIQSPPLLTPQNLIW